MQGAEEENQAIAMSGSDEEPCEGCGTTETSSDIEHSEKLKAAAATIKVDNSEKKPGVTMCHNFARATCKKSAACRGDTTRVSPPQSEAGAGLPPDYSNAAPILAIPCVSPAVVQYNAEPGAEQSDPNIFNLLQSVTSTNTSSPKHAWSDEVGSSTGVLDSGEPLAMKCNRCDSTYIREQQIKKKLEERTRAYDELRQKVAQLEVKIFMRALFQSHLNLQRTDEKKLPNPSINQGQLQCNNEFVTSPIENMSIAGVGQMESERLDDTIEPKEEHRRDDLELENADYGYSNVEDTRIQHSESYLDVIECKTELEEEQEVLGKKRRASDTRRATAAKKPKDTRSIKRKDGIREEQKKNETSDTKVIQTTEETDTTDPVRNRTSTIYVSVVLTIREIYL